MGCTYIDKLTSADPPSFVDKEAEESKDAVTGAELAATVQVALRMKMSVKFMNRRMKLLFMEYSSLLRTNDIKWGVNKTLEVAIRHVLSAVKPVRLRSRLEQDLAFFYHHLKADFNWFINHALEVSQAFEKVDSGPPRSHKSDKKAAKTKSRHVSSGSSSSKGGLKADAHSKGDKM